MLGAHMRVKKRFRVVFVLSDVVVAFFGRADGGFQGGGGDCGPGGDGGGFGRSVHD